MGNLVKHARKELELAGLFDESGDFYGGFTGRCIMELIEVLENQGHSGISVGAVTNVFKKLANFEFINPITGDESEWIEVSDNTWKSNRIPSLFKDGTGKAYYLDAIVWREKNGNTFTGIMEGISSRQYVKFPFVPKTFYVAVDGDKIINTKRLKEAIDYYKLPTTIKG